MLISMHSEGHDRNDLTLPGKQQDLLEAIRNATKNPMIVVVMSGGPVDISWAKVSQCVTYNSNACLTISCRLMLMPSFGVAIQGNQVVRQLHKLSMEK